MKMRKTASVLLTLLAVLSASAVSSCGEAASPVSDNTAPAETEAEPAETVDPEAPEIRDLGGYEFVANVRSDMTGNASFACEYFSSEGENGESINDAVFRRNSEIEDTFNCKIVKRDSTGEQYLEISRSVQAGEALECAVVLGTNAASLAQEGMLLDLYETSIDFSKRCWDKNAIDSFAIGGHMYLITGDMNISTWDVTRVSVFSKKLVSDLDLDDPYQLVRDGKWTLDRMISMALSANVDLDNDGKITKDDQVGLYIYNWAPEYYVYGAGERVSTMDADGYPVFSVFNERSAEVFNKIYDICTQTRTDTAGGFSGDQKAAFTVDRCLFTQFSVWDIRKDLRTSCQNDFGILPIPKYDDAQEDYYNLVTFQNCTHLWCIPVTCSDPAKASVVFEALGYYSTDTLRAAYYDTTLQGKVLRDNDSAEMLDIIFANRIYDLALIYNWGKWDDYLCNARTAKNNFASTYEKKLPQTEEEIAKTVEAYQSVG